MIYDFSPIWISLKTSFTATIITLLLGVAAAWWVAACSGRMKGFIDGIFILPMVLPPTVVGFFLLLMFGRYGPVGRLLDLIDYNVIFSWAATVIAATVVSFPLMYKAARSSFEMIDPHLLDAARLLGASEWKTFIRISVPLAWPGIAAGAILAFARALGEFGATLMLAGNIPGRTQTIPIAIYFAVEGGEMAKAYLWVAIILAISFATIMLMNAWTERQRNMISMNRK